MKIAICDDDPNEIATIRSHIESHKMSHEIHEYTSAKPFLRLIGQGGCCDLLFLDIQMPDSSGWEIANDLKKSKTKIYIAMVSMFGDYMEYCFDRVDWFAQKPVTQEKIHLILDKAHEKLFPISFEFQSGGANISLCIAEILYFEVWHNDLAINTFNKKYNCRMPLGEVLKKTAGMPCFVQTHRSFVINLDFFKEIKGNDVLLKNGQIIPLSKSLKKAFMLGYANYLKKT